MDSDRGKLAALTSIKCHSIQETMPAMSSRSDFLPLWSENELAHSLTAGSERYGMPINDRDALEANFADYLMTLGQRDNISLIHLHCSQFLSTIAKKAKARNGDTSRFKEAGTTACAGRRFFLLDDGRIGLANTGPAAMREDGWVSVLFGSSMPFIL